MQTHLSPEYQSITPLTLDQLLIENNCKHPQKTALITNHSEICFQELTESSIALGKMLIDLGITPGSCVGYILPKSTEFVLGIYAIIFSGGIFFPLDPYQPLARLEQVLEQTRPQALICQSEYLESILSCKHAPFRKNIITTTRMSSDYLSLQDLRHYYNSPITLPKLYPLDPVYLNFTSGTTGVPKGALTSHSNIYFNTLSAVKALNLNHEDIHLCMFPSFVHPHDIFARAIFLGGSLVLLDSIKPKTIANALSRFRVSAFMAVGSIYETLIRLKDLHKRDLSSLRVAESGGMYVSSSLNQSFKEKAGINITPVWGSTETTGIALAGPLDREFPLQSMGKPCPFYHVLALDEKGQEAKPYETGELVISGPGVCAGYLDNLLESKKYFELCGHRDS